MRNFICEATGVNCTKSECKRGYCILEKEAGALASTIAAIQATKKKRAGHEQKGTKRIDPTYARRVLFMTVEGMTHAQVLERLKSDDQLTRIAMAVPEVRAEYRRRMKAKAGP